MNHFLMQALTFIMTMLVTLPASSESIFRKDNLVAWCVVPFDASKRDPVARAQMLNELGLKKLAYDWREEHIPTFEDEFNALTKYEIELTAFWIPIGFTPQDDPTTNMILDLLEKHSLSTQIWITIHGASIDKLEETKRIKAYSEPISYVATKAKEFNSRVALYNHGGWFGDPENQIKIIKATGMDNVGIVYNLHHGHEHLDHFDVMLETMLPYLMAFNLNGMRKEGPKILPLGQGDLELELLKKLKSSGFKGPIGILDHRNELDAKESLLENLEGMKRLVKQLNDNDAYKTY